MRCGAGLTTSPNLLKTWWPGTELNRRRQPFQSWIQSALSTSPMFAYLIALPAAEGSGSRGYAADRSHLAGLRRAGLFRRWSRLSFLCRTIAKASSIRTLTSQLRKAPSHSKVGGFREAEILQFFTTSSNCSGLPSTRHARKQRISWHRANPASNTAERCRRLLDVRMSPTFPQSSIITILP